MMQQNKSLKKSSSKKSFISFFLLGLIVFLFLISITTIFKIKKVESISKNTKNKLLGTESLIGENLLLLNEKETISFIENENPQIKIQNFLKIYPDKIKIEYLLVSPSAFIRTTEGILLLNKEAKIIKKDKELNSTKNLTEIFYYQKFDYQTSSIGAYVDYVDIKYSLNILSKLKKFKYQVESIDIARPSMIRLNLTESVVIFTTEKDVDDQINKLEKIIKQFKVEGKTFSSLDLRFDKPILKLN